METAVTILRELWLKRVSVVLCAVAAIVCGGLVAYAPGLPPESRKYEVGVANARILIDTPSSQAVEVAPKGSESLGAHASLLANLMTEGDLKAAIAKRAGLDPARLLTVAPSAIGSDTVSGSELRNPAANVLSTSVLTDDAGEQLSIIDVDTQAINAERAAAIANAAVTGLQQYLDSRASDDGVSVTRRLQVRPLGAAQARTVARGPSGVIALVASILIFGTLCAILLFADALARGWRVASDVEGLGADFDDPAWQLDTSDHDEDERSTASRRNGNGDVPDSRDAEVGAGRR